VLPRHQRRGVGAALVRAGLARSITLGYDFVVVLGQPAYYRRFGFETASRFDLANQYGADEAFMALPLHPAGRSAVAGLIRYQPEFR